MARLASIEEIAASTTDLDPDATRQLLASGNDEEKTLAILAMATRLATTGAPGEALQMLLSARQHIGFSPTPVMACLIELSLRTHRTSEAARACRLYADDAWRMGYADLALEACSAALLLDSAGQFGLIRDPVALKEIAGLYEEISRTLARPPQRPCVRRTGPLRVGLLVPNLVDDIVANTKTLLHFARWVDASRFELRVYSSENLSGRLKPLFPYGANDGHSRQRGARSIQELLKRGVPVWLGPVDTMCSDAAIRAAAQIAADEVDVLIVQSGLACPIDWLAARLSNVPVKMTIHTGASLFMNGCDMNLLDNPANIEREAPVWPAAAGPRRILCQGTDVDELERQPAMLRARLGIPESAVIAGVLSNHLATRMSPAYLDIVASLLQAHPSLWFVAFGSAHLPGPAAYFEQRGVLDRVRFAGRQTESGSALKMLDLYLNEFPVGGSQSVIEAMVCSVPVVALRWSDAHAESAGAEVVGTEYALQAPDVVAYRQLAERWILDCARRHEAGSMLRQRALERYSVRRYVGQVLDIADELYSRKCCEPLPSAGTG